MQKLITAMSLACAAVVACGCGSTQAPKPTAKEKDAATRTQLIGTWERQSELGPVGYQRQFNADGTLVLREFGEKPTTSASTTSASVLATSQAALTMYHSQYKRGLPLRDRKAGTWTVEGDKLIKTVQLSNGDTIRIISRIDGQVGREFVEVSDGINGPMKLKYQRK